MLYKKINEIHMFGISVMAEAADIAGWFLCVFRFCHVAIAKHCEEINFLSTFREFQIDYLFGYIYLIT